MSEPHRIVAESHLPGGTYKADAAGNLTKVKERSEVEAEQRAMPASTAVGPPDPPRGKRNLERG